VLIVRPKIAELVFQLYGRALHPELFEVVQTRNIERGGYRAQVQITGAGHVVTWRYGGLTLTEVAASAHQPLPLRRRLISKRLRGERTDRVECRGGVTYHTNFQLELTSPAVYWGYLDELSQNGAAQGMLHRFDSNGRVAMGAVSYINTEVRDRSMRVQAFHTFPDDYAIVKSQSLFELP